MANGSYCQECGAAEFQTHTLGCTAQYMEDASFDFGANIPELVFVPTCTRCGQELCDALDKTWSDDQDDTQCYKCRRNPNRKWGDR
jgi:hypothetical protein